MRCMPLFARWPHHTRMAVSPSTFPSNEDSFLQGSAISIPARETHKMDLIGKKCESDSVLVSDGKTSFRESCGWYDGVFTRDAGTTFSF